MKVVIIGSGNVASVFGRLIKKAGHQVLQVVSRNIDHARSLGDELGCTFSNDIKQLDGSAEIYLAATSDAALRDFHTSVYLGDKIIVHTAGAVSKEVLAEISSRYGVIYPLQSLRKENRDLPDQLPLLIDGNSTEVTDIIDGFCTSISSSIARVSDEQRAKLHVAAVIVSNFTNHLYALADDYCIKEGLDFKMLQPLIEETAFRLREYLPEQMQTGPAIRKDTPTLEKHLRLLSQHPGLRKLYLRMTDSIMNPDSEPHGTVR